MVVVLYWILYQSPSLPRYVKVAPRLPLPMRALEVLAAARMLIAYWQLAIVTFVGVVVTGVAVAPGAGVVVPFADT